MIGTYEWEGRVDRCMRQIILRPITFTWTNRRPGQFSNSLYVSFDCHAHGGSIIYLYVRFPSLLYFLIPFLVMVSSHFLGRHCSPHLARVINFINAYLFLIHGTGILKSIVGVLKFLAADERPSIKSEVFKSA